MFLQTKNAFAVLSSRLAD